MTEQTIIGLYGPQGVGKSTLAAQLRPLGFQVEPFAKVLKEMAAPLQQYMNLVEKNEDCPYLGFSPRKLQQTLGTEVGRALNEDLWLRVMEKRIQGMRRVVIDDVRFDNEYHWIGERGGMLISIASTEFGMDQLSDHSSEQDWLSWPTHFEFLNNDDLSNSFADYVHQSLLLREKNAR